MKNKYTFLLEILIGASIILFINFMFFNNNIGFEGVSPNPYWIIVIFIAVRYGSFPGLAAGILCALALLGSIGYDLFQFLEPGKKFELSMIPYKQVQLSVLFILIGFLVGEERSRVNRLFSAGKEKYNDLRGQLSDLAMEHSALKSVNAELESRVLGQTETVNTVYEIARDLTSTKLDYLYPAVVGIVEKFIHPEKCSFYVWEDKEYILKGQKGWGDDIGDRKVLRIDSDILRKALNEKKTVTVSDVFKSKGLRWKAETDPVMAAPIFVGGEKETATGLILVDEIAFTKLNPNSVRFLSIIADWVSKSLDNALASTTIRRKDVYDEDLKVFNYNYALRRLNEEFLNVKLTGNLSSFILVKLQDFDKIQDDKKKDIFRSVGSVLNNTLRGGDTVAKHMKDDTFICILPGSDTGGAKIAADRIQSQIDKPDIKPFGDERKLKVDLSIRLLDPKYASETEILSAD